MKRLLLASAALALLAAAPAHPPTPTEILAAAPASAWAEVDPARMLLMELADGATVTIELAPDFAPVHVANILRLARAGWFDGTSINRVQDNYVVQWGDATEAKKLPAGIVATPPAEYERAADGLAFTPLGFRDAYAAETGHVDGWPAGREDGRAWLVHCYGMVGVGRGLAPDTGSGAELYAVIGHAPRHLDRNIAIVGRLLSGIDSLAARPRGTEALGFYKTPSERIPIRRLRVVADMPFAERPRFAVLNGGTPTFAAWVRARANRQDDFFIRPAGAVDICNAQAPVRRIGG